MILYKKEPKKRAKQAKETKEIIWRERERGEREREEEISDVVFTNDE